MSERFEDMFSALERQASDLTQRLESARARIRALEDTNRQLAARLSRIQQMSGAESETTPAFSALSDDNPSAIAVTLEDDESRQVDPGGSDVSGLASEDVIETPARTHSSESVPENESVPEKAASVADTTPASVDAKTVVSEPIEDISPQALLKQWYRRYPNTFFERHTRPLAVGIHEALSAREPYNEKLIRRALAGYVNLPRYLKSVRANAARIDLEGQQAGSVGEEDARHAQEQLRRLQQRQQEREAEKQKRRLAQKMSELAHRHQR